MVRRGSIEKNFRDIMTHCHDTIPLDEEFETQIVNFEEETQVVDFDAETQLLDSQYCYENLETQIVDDFDTQVVVDSESEESGRTEEQYLGDELLDDNDSVGQKGGGDSRGQAAALSDELCGSASLRASSLATRRASGLDDNDSVGQKGEKISCNGENRGQAAALSDELCGSGSIKRGFTSIRAASLRASGLAARSATQHGYNSETSSLLSHRKSPQEGSTAQANEQSFIIVSSKSQIELDKRDVEEVKDDRNCRSGSSAARRLFTEEVADLNTKDLHSGDDNLAGLSYIDSQEPGDFSQATAMDFVDRYLKANVEESQHESCIKRCGGGNTVAVSSGAKGPQSLSRKTTRVKAQEKGTFDWDDDLEDDRGGDLFCKRKEEFFDGGSKSKSRKEPRKPRVTISDGNVDTRNRPSSLPNIKKGIVLSSSKIISDAEVAEKDLARNLGDEFVTESTEPLREQSELEYTVGFDTQLAAEAMEALCQEDGFTRKDGSAAHEGEQKDKYGVVSRQSKKTNGNNPDLGTNLRVSQLRSSKNIKKHQELVKEKSKGTVRKNREEAPSNIFQSRKNGENGTFTPIARRTRRSKMAREMHEERYSDQVEIDGAVEADIDKSKGVPAAARRTRSMAKGEVSTNHQVDRSEGASKLSLGLEWSRQSVPRRKRTSSDASDANLSRKKQNKNLISKFRSVEYKLGEEPQPIQNLNVQAIAEKDEPPKETSDASDTTVCITPVSNSTPAKDASPVCVGSDYLKQTCKKNLSRSKEIESLTALRPEASPSSAVRKRREMAEVRILYSRHLEDAIVKQQNKILTRLGVSVAKSIADATHFVTDEFVRTRNMLEAIASGKPVVTHLWLESCGEANCFLDDRNYILRDSKKEKEIGFSMPVSLARACHHPLLQDQRVLITSNTKPDLGVISALVKAVGGQPTERIARSALRDDKLPDLLILSCEEDYDVCVPFLERGAAVYSSELLLNGIVTQKLEYERHRLFGDHVKRTRSMVWLKKDGKKFVPVARNR